MEEFWGLVDWNVGCLLLIVAIVFSFLFGMRSGRIRERSEYIRHRIRQNKANVYRYKRQLASFHAQVERLEQERDSLASRSEAYEQVESELATYRQNIQKLEQDILALSSDPVTYDKSSAVEELDVFRLICDLKDDPVHTNLTKVEWSEFINKTDVLFNNFLTDLRTKFSITRHEQEICCLVKWNFSRKEQLAVFNNTPDALTKSKGRLKKRLNLDEKTDLDSFIRLL